MLAYKGFNKDLICTLGKGQYQYEIGKTFKESKAKCVAAGLHCAEYPADCFTYYPIGNGNRYFLVEAGGHIDEDARDSKIACTEMTLLQELTIQDMMYATIEYLFAHPHRPFEHRSEGVVVAKDEAKLTKNGGFCIAFGKDPRVMATVDNGMMVLLTADDNGEVAGAKLLKVGVNGVKKNTWYTNAKEWTKKVVKPSAHTMGADTCVTCGEPIPEGRHVCPNCEAKYEKENDREPAIQKSRRRKAD